MMGMISMAGTGGGMMGGCPMTGDNMGMHPKRAMRMHGETMKANGTIEVTSLLLDHDTNLASLRTRKFFFRKDCNYLDSAAPPFGTLKSGWAPRTSS